MLFSGVWLRYRRRDPWVLEDVTFALDPGDVAIVLGRNGAGKSTLLQTAAGVLRPNRGRITGRPATVGWVPERFPANQPRTVRSYLIAMARVRGLSGSAAVDAWAERLYLTPHLSSRLAEVSKGTAQKVGLTQALLKPPGLLVLDEPWEGLDAQTREQVPGIVAEVVAAGGAVLISDHRGEVSRLPGARLCHLANGELVVDEPDLGPARSIVEVAVASAEVPAAVARLRSAGFEIHRVRAEES